MDLLIPSHALAVFIDDTGDETFRDPGNPLFGLGGCAVLGSELDTLVRAPWASVRERLGKDRDSPLHANAVERRMNTAKEQALNQFFSERRIGRVGALSSVTTRYEITTVADHVLVTTARALLGRITALVALTPCSSVICIFEESHRHFGRLEAALSELSLTEHLPNGGEQEIPLSWHRMPKTAAEPALEVADFMMHAAAGHHRLKQAEHNKFKRRADAIWAPSDSRLSHFITIESVRPLRRTPRQEKDARRVDDHSAAACSGTFGSSVGTPSLSRWGSRGMSSKFPNAR
jgi:hypothetical protein